MSKINTPIVEQPVVETEDVDVAVNYEQLAEELRVQNERLKKELTEANILRMRQAKEIAVTNKIVEALADTINLIDLQISMLRKNLNNINGGSKNE
jgi:hypothetical protein